MSNEQEELWAQIVTFMEVQIPFNAYLGVKVARIDSGYALMHLPWRDAFIGDPFRKVLHGGVTCTLMDVSGGAAAFTQVNIPHDRLSTVDLRVDYLRPGPRADLYCEAVVERMGNRMASTRMTLYGAHPDHATEETPLQPIASGRGVYNIRRA
mgnify:CR=1 FL=1